MHKTRSRWLWPVVALCLVAGPAALADEPEALAAAREFMVLEVAEYARATASVTGRPVIDRNILEAMREVPRHAFVPKELARYAYLNVPLPAGNGLRESQPFMVALMSDLVSLGPEDDVLIMGIGGGYHAALASKLAGRVYCLDLDGEAAAVAMGRLQEGGYGNIETRIDDPYYGWPEAGRQFDAIIVRLSVDAVPAAILRQLKPGGRLIAPVGRSAERQDLTLVTRGENGELSERRILPVRFMRLPGGERI